MAKIIIELDDQVLAKAFAAALQDSTVEATQPPSEKPKPKAAKEEDEPTLEEDFLEACEQVKPRELRKILKPWGSSASKVKDKDLEDAYNAIMDFLEVPEENDDVPEQEEDEIDTEEVKIACQKFTKENGKKAADALYQEFGINSLRSLKKLSDDDLRALYKAVTEDDEGDDQVEVDDDVDPDEINLAVVKSTCEEFQKANGKDTMEEILDSYGIASLRSLRKLEQEDLEDLYAEITEDD